GIPLCRAAAADVAKRFKRVERAAAVIWKMLMVAQTRFRRLNAPELLAKVYTLQAFKLCRSTWPAKKRISSMIPAPSAWPVWSRP
ncbi:MAG: hypothetical protein QN140_08545, partial [Armatimonadota bacterium]|nr:hypothetical protein [Armatimonadota bacterium]